ncbi:MAG: HAD-IA family hydrolase [Comamonadaceae bacterium]|nr:HAD-IA family hydrolase [Comamonadaceae bacterium]
MLEFHGKPIEAAIFDMDGTMFDTERLRFKTLTQAAQELAGVPLPEQLLIDCLGLSAVSAAALTRERLGAEFPYEAVRQHGDTLELAHVRAHGVPIKRGLLPVLERLRRAGLKMAVATSSRRAIAEEYLINAGVYKYFDLLVCGDEVSRGKPAPEIFERAASALHCPVERALMLEDSENGVRSAVSAGGQVIVVLDIKPLPDDVTEGALARYASMAALQADLAECTPRLPMPAPTEPFPQAINQQQVGIHGFGAMGGGYLAQVLSHWDGYTRPGRIVASTGNALLREAVNAFGSQYSVRYGSMAFDQAIERLHMIDSADTAAVAAMYRDCDPIALCLPESAIAGQASAVAQGLKDRLAASGRPLTVLVVLNKVGGAGFVREQVAQALRMVMPASQAERVLDRTDFVETVVTRIVSKLTEAALLRQLRIKRDLYQRNMTQRRIRFSPEGTQALADLSVDGGRALAPIVDTLRDAGEPARAMAPLHLVLFNSETDMPLYAQAGSPVLEHLRQVKTVPDITQVQQLKNRLWNGTHAIIAWKAALLGHATIGEAMSDPRVTTLMERVLTQELAPAFRSTYPGLATQLPDFIETFRARCTVAFKDPCRRVGRDPLRKLQRGERVLGSLSMARQAGIASPGLAMGAALAVQYALMPGVCGARDPECQRIRALYAQRQSLRDVLTWEGPYQGRPYDGLRPDSDPDDALVLDEIELAFEALKAEPVVVLEPSEAGQPVPCVSP